MRIKNMTWQCYQVELLIEYALGTVVHQNMYNPLLVLANCMSGSFYLISDLLAQFANLNYEDWFSVAYHFGDMFYRTLAIDK